METSTEWNWCLLSPTPKQVFENHMASYNALRGTWNAITPKKADNKALHGWWKYWRQQGKHFLLGAPAKSKMKIGRNYSFYIQQAYLVVCPSKCKMAFHPECMSCQLSRLHLTASKL
jgi:hypothetical protein